MNAPPLNRQILVAVGMLAAVAVIAVIGTIANAPHTDGWYASAEKVAWSPPNAVFGPVWTILYVLIALSGWLIWRAGYQDKQPNRARGPLIVFALQLILNGLWSPVFFAGYPLIGNAALWIALILIVALIASVVWLAIATAPWSKTAAWIMAPYLLWLLFATSLNIGVIALN